MSTSPQLPAWEDRANPTRAALEEALRLNYPAFPCRSDKTPATPNGFKAATSDPDGIRQLWRDHPGPLIGVPTGEISGLFVLDIDSTRHEEANDWLERHSPYLPETRRHQTKSGGLHFLFHHPGGLRNSQSKLAPGVDTRGDGGYIIWWPLCLGLCAGHNFRPIAPLPDWLLAALLPPPIPSKVKFLNPAFGQPRAAVQGVLNAVASAREGNRNSILYWGACCIRDMIANHQIGSSEGAVSFHALTSVGIHVGLSQREIARTIQSAVVRK